MATSRPITHALGTAYDLRVLGEAAHEALLDVITGTRPNYLSTNEQARLLATLDTAQACIDSLRTQLTNGRL